jgi:cell division protease FtsH
VADRTPGFAGADLMNLVNEAALLAARKGKTQVDAVDFDESREKILRGIEREDLINDAERKIVAYHEAGHALLARLLPGGDPIQKVSIIPRGHSLGATEIIPEEDRHSFSRTYLLNRLSILLAGRVSEKLIFNDVTTEASDDLKKASQLARRMVTQWGMSKRLGSVSFQLGEEHQYLGREHSTVKEFSEHTARMVDEEVQEIIREVESRAEEILKPNRKKLDLLAEALLEQESLDKVEIERLLDGQSEPQLS